MFNNSHPLIFEQKYVLFLYMTKVYTQKNINGTIFLTLNFKIILNTFKEKLVAITNVNQIEFFYKHLII